MTDLLIVGAALAALVGLMWHAGRAADRLAASGRPSRVSSLRYALALGVYCTTLTFYGSVGTAATDGLLYLSLYLAPTIALVTAPTILQRLISLKTYRRFSSPVDLLEARYGSSQTLGALVALLVLVGTAPYIAAQLRAIITSFVLITGASGDHGATIGWARVVMFVVAAWFTTHFGQRHLDPTQRQPGLMAMLASTSIVKIIVMVGAGAYISLALLGSPEGFVNALTTGPALRINFLSRIGLADALNFVAHMLLVGVTFILLPHQFHVWIVENESPAHLRTATWAVPLFMFAASVFVIPVAVAGLHAAPGVRPDTYMLALPMMLGARWLAIAVFVGGFAAGIAMVIVAAAAISTLVTSHVIVPVIEQRKALHPLRTRLLECRRATAIGFLAFAGLGEAAVGHTDTLTRMGLLSFAAVLQLAPASIAGLHWRGASRRGVLAGLAAGTALWFYCLFLPAIVRGGWLPLSLVADGPFGIHMLRPEALFGIEGLPPIAHGVLWSLFVNLLAFFIGSVGWPANATEEAEAERFFEENGSVLGDQGSGAAFIPATDKTTAMIVLLARYYPPEDAARLVDLCVRETGLTGRARLSVVQVADLTARVESVLAGAIGAAAAHTVVRKEIGFSTGERRELEAAYGRILARLRLSPAELRKRVDFFRERESYLQAQAQELETQVKQRTQELAESNELLRQEIEEGDRKTHALDRARAEIERILASVPSALISVDAAGRVIFWNDWADRMFGIPASEVLFRPFRESGIRWDWVEFDRRVDPVATGEWVVRIDDMACDGADERRLFLTVWVCSLPAGEGEAPGILVFASDVTERKNLEHRLVQTKKLEAVGRLAAGMAHEINTPMQFLNSNLAFAEDGMRSLVTGIQVYHRLLDAVASGEAAEAVVGEAKAERESGGLDFLLEELPTALKEAREGVTKVSEIVRALQTSAQDGAQDVIATNINTFVDRALTLSRHEWSPFASMSKEYDPRIPPVPVSASDLTEALVNLIVNAAHAINDAGRADQGHICIRTKREGRHAEIRIEDNGCGIPQAARDRIFDPFFTTKEVGRGTGQGLTVARASIVEKHRGTLEFESTEGIGTTFIIRLPLAFDDGVPDLGAAESQHPIGA